MFCGCLPTRQGSAAERVLVPEHIVGYKPASFDFVEAAAFPVTYGTAYEALIEHLGIKNNEQAAILIINGAGGMFHYVIIDDRCPVTSLVTKGIG